MGEKQMSAWEHINYYASALERISFDAGDSVVPAPPSWRCAYCDDSNDAKREECRGCRAPRPEAG